MTETVRGHPALPPRNSAHRILCGVWVDFSFLLWIFIAAKLAYSIIGYNWDNGQQEILGFQKPNKGRVYRKSLEKWVMPQHHERSYVACVRWCGGGMWSELCWCSAAACYSHISQLRWDWRGSGGIFFVTCVTGDRSNYHNKTVVCWTAGLVAVKVKCQLWNKNLIL